MTTRMLARHHWRHLDPLDLDLGLLTYVMPGDSGGVNQEV